MQVLPKARPAPLEALDSVEIGILKPFLSAIRAPSAIQNFIPPHQ
jgi:hypothetical protein